MGKSGGGADLDTNRVGGIPWGKGGNVWPKSTPHTDKHLPRGFYYGPVSQSPWNNDLLHKSNIRTEASAGRKHKEQEEMYRKAAEESTRRSGQWARSGGHATLSNLSDHQRSVFRTFNSLPVKEQVRVSQ